MARHRVRRRMLRLRVLVPVILLVAAGGYCAAQLLRPVPGPALRPVLTNTVRVGGSPPALPWPSQGEAAVGVPSLGIVVASGAEQPVPIASLTKMMTAYVVLKDHPLASDAQGPELLMTAVDQSDAAGDSAGNDSMVPVQAGESLSERQLLDGLLVHSAADFADTLARWDAGSIATFVSKMNSTAASLEMTQTHYSDTSGIDPGSTSTAADQVRLAEAAMRIPTFAAVVAQPSVSLPLAGTLYNYVSQVGSDGVVGVKSGFTQEAMGCLVLAGRRTVDGREVTVLAAVTGQGGPEPLESAADATLPLLDATAKGLRVVPVLAHGQRAVVETTAWDPGPAYGTPQRGLSALVWPGEVVERSVTTRRLRHPPSEGSVLGTVEVTVGRERESVDVVSSADVSGPSVEWRLLRV